MQVILILKAHRWAGFRLMTPGTGLARIKKLPSLDEFTDFCASDDAQLAVDYSV
jgi:hypothetical protein